MIRLFKHYIPNAVFLLGLFDFLLLIASGEWQVEAFRAHQDRHFLTVAKAAAKEAA